MKLIIDANTHAGVGEVFAGRGHDVVYVNQVFPQGTTDDTIADFARVEHRIIVGHDKDFNKRVQLSIYQFSDTIKSGYGRIMLIGRESKQPGRVAATLSYIEHCHGWALAHDQRFLMAIADHYIRWDDGLLERSEKPSRPHFRAPEATA